MIMHSTAWLVSMLYQISDFGTRFVMQEKYMRKSTYEYIFPVNVFLHMCSSKGTVNVFKCFIYCHLYISIKRPFHGL